MTTNDRQLGEEFVRLALAVNEHLPGYVDSYFGPEEWAQEAKQAGKLVLRNLNHRADQLASSLSGAGAMDAQRKNFLARQISAMQMSLRLLGGERVSLTEEVQGLYDIQPTWKDESTFLDAQKMLDEILPGDGTLKERIESWKKSLEIPVETVRELLPIIRDRLRALTRGKFDLPEEESFTVEFVSNQPWSAYNWYLGGYRSRIDLNTDLPTRISWLPDLIAHEAYPGHHTELSIKEAKLVRQRDYQEHIITLINAPSCVIAEGLATTALAAVLSDEELEDWYRKEILPRAGMSHVDAKTILEVDHASRKLAGVAGNAAFMLHDRQNSPDEISRYIQEYNLSTEKEAAKTIEFISNPLYRSYIFTYHVGRELLEELFAAGDRDRYFVRLLEEPVTPTQVRQWMMDQL